MRLALLIAVLMCIPVLVLVVILTLVAGLAEAFGEVVIGWLDAWELATRRGGAGA